MNSLLMFLFLVSAILIAQCSASRIPEGMPLIFPKDATPSPQLLNPPTPPLIFPSDASTPPPPPLIFPEDVKTYNIVKNNATILAALTHQAQEVGDLLHTNKGKEQSKISEPSTTKATTQKPVTEKVQARSTTVSSASDEDVEMVQPIHEERQKNEHEERFNRPTHRHHKIHEEEEFLKSMRVNDTTAIMAGSFAAVAVLGFAGLVMWRQMLEKRYGTRERLVTEDTYYANNDLRHFEKNVSLVPALNATPSSSGKN